MVNSFFTLSDAAALIGLSQSTLKNYERQGICVPIRDSANRRLYTEADLHVIREFRRRSAPNRDPEIAAEAMKNDQG
jgi:DNA-binding transcriptional MerR regulator